jgi:hypothetical protein
MALISVTLTIGCQNGFQFFPGPVQANFNGLQRAPDNISNFSILQTL